MYRIHGCMRCCLAKGSQPASTSRGGGCGQRPLLRDYTPTTQNPPNSIPCSSPGLLFLGRATHHMSNGRHRWDDVTVYFEGHPGASVSLASHTPHVSSQTARDTHRSTNSEQVISPSNPQLQGLLGFLTRPTQMPLSPGRALISPRPSRPAPGVPSSGDSAKSSRIPSARTTLLAQMQVPSSPPSLMFEEHPATDIS